jgi:hypothetical protein
MFSVPILADPFLAPFRFQSDGGTMVNDGLVERFIVQELSPHVRKVLRETLQQRAGSDKILARQCEFNCFDIEFDFLKDVVVVQDVLGSAEESSVEMPISDFVILCGLNER